MSAKLPDKVIVFSDGSKTCPMCEQTPYGSSFRSLASVFLKLAESKMNPTQKSVLVHSVNTLRYREVSLTTLADLVSRKSGVAYSTVKWNLRSLVAMGFLVGGDINNRGEPAHFTEEALMLVEYLEDIR
ncbi:MAG: hypothetical protein ACFFED_01425 [Candidatus Thorarchaeota archaeon]